MSEDARERLILALDVASSEEAENLVRLLSSEVGVFKVGLELFVAEGPSVLERLRRAGARSLFLDLKLHDIPATMRAAAKSASRHHVDLLTCHCDQPDIFTGLDLGPVRILGVTVLTSLGAGDLQGLGYELRYQDPRALVLKRAELALLGGCQGVICSGLEAAQVRGALGPEALIVCPGIRPHGPRLGADDQKRVVTPQMAIAAGATHIVVGRPIRAAADPLKAAQAVVEGIEQGIQEVSGTPTGV